MLLGAASSLPYHAQLCPGLFQDPPIHIHVKQQHGTELPSASQDWAFTQDPWKGALSHGNKRTRGKDWPRFVRSRGKENELSSSLIFCVIANAWNIDHFNMLLSSFHFPTVSRLPAHSDLKVSNKYHFKSANVFWPTQSRRQERERRAERDGNCCLYKLVQAIYP